MWERSCLGHCGETPSFLGLGEGMLAPEQSQGGDCGPGAGLKEVGRGERRSEGKRPEGD